MDILTAALEKARPSWSDTTRFSCKSVLFPRSTKGKGVFSIEFSVEGPSSGDFTFLTVCRNEETWSKEVFESIA